MWVRKISCCYSSFLINTYFHHIILFFPPDIDLSTCPQRSCAGLCGSKVTGGRCYCDEPCIQAGDCCWDYREQCTDSDTPTVPRGNNEAPPYPRMKIRIVLPTNNTLNVPLPVVDFCGTSSSNNSCLSPSSVADQIPACDDRYYYKNMECARCNGAHLARPFVTYFQCEHWLVESISQMDGTPTADFFWRLCPRVFKLPSVCRKRIRRMIPPLDVRHCLRSPDIYNLHHKCSSYYDPIQITTMSVSNSYSTNMACFQCTRPVYFDPIINITCAKRRLQLFRPGQGFLPNFMGIISFMDVEIRGISDNRSSEMASVSSQSLPSNMMFAGLMVNWLGSMVLVRFLFWWTITQFNLVHLICVALRLHRERTLDH